jgi:hypothetical protein
VIYAIPKNKSGKLSLGEINEQNEYGQNHPGSISEYQCRVFNIPKLRDYSPTVIQNNTLNSHHLSTGQLNWLSSIQFKVVDRIPTLIGLSAGFEF